MWAAEAGPQPAALPVGAVAWPGGGTKETAGPVETDTEMGLDNQGHIPLIHQRLYIASTHSAR